MFPNGSVITPDGRTLIVGETVGGALHRVQHRRGRVADRPAGVGAGGRARGARAAGARCSAKLEFEPDGCALDAEGCIWSADAKNGRCVRLAEGGEILDEIAAGTGVFACMLGGEDGRTLLMCTAPSFVAHERIGQTRRAAREPLEVDVPHAGLP